MNSAEKEFEAIRTVHSALEPLGEDARSRVLTYIAGLLDIEAHSVSRSGSSAAKDLDGEQEAEGIIDINEQALTFSSFAELFAAANPKSGGERALVAGYWLQVCQKAGSFTGAAVNKELTHLGHRLGHVTDAIESMKSKKPMLMLQIKKSGTSRQARKLYKITHEGTKRVEEMVGG